MNPHLRLFLINWGRELICAPIALVLVFVAESILTGDSALLSFLLNALELIVPSAILWFLLMFLWGLAFPRK